MHLPESAANIADRHKDIYVYNMYKYVICICISAYLYNDLYRSCTSDKAWHVVAVMPYYGIDSLLDSLGVVLYAGWSISKNT